MTDQLDDVIQEAIEAQPEPAATGAGVREELHTLTMSAAPTADGTPQAPRVSRKGEIWNPRLHASPPSETARGTWRKLLGPNLSPVGSVDALPVAPAPVSPAEAAHNTCATAFDTCALLLDQVFPLGDGVEWQPTEKERENIERALTRFYELHPEWAVDLPPGAALAFAVAGYALPRLMAVPQVRELLQRVMHGRAKAKLKAHEEQEERRVAA